MDENINWDEIGKIVENEIDSLKKESSIIWDGKQFSIRIPKKFADVMKLNQEKDKFLFELTATHIDDQGEATAFELSGKIIKHD